MAVLTDLILSNTSRFQPPHEGEMMNNTDSYPDSLPRAPECSRCQHSSNRMYSGSALKRAASWEHEVSARHRHHIPNTPKTYLHPDTVITPHRTRSECTVITLYPDTLQPMKHSTFSPKRVVQQAYFNSPDTARVLPNHIQLEHATLPGIIDDPNNHFSITTNRSFSKKSTSLAQIPTDRPVTNLPYFFDDPYYQIGAFYGKAVGMTYVQGPPKHPKAWRCTTWISGGPFIITNEHCYRNSQKVKDLPEFPFPVRLAAFGLFGQKDSENHDVGLQFIENRLIDLGIPNSDVSQLKYLPYDPGFTCRIVDDEMNAYGNFRDIAYYQCDPLPITYSLSGHQEHVQLLPSHIFGHIPIVANEIKKKFKLPPATRVSEPINPPVQAYHIGMAFDNDKPIGMKKDGLFLSPDFIHSVGRPIGWTDYAYGYTISGWTRLGVSGSPLLDTQNQAIGIIDSLTGANDFPENALAFTGREVVYDSLFAKNATVPGLVKHAYIEPSLTSGLSHVVPRSTQESFTCPYGYASAGIIGSSIRYAPKTLFPNASLPDEPNAIGNLGLVCLPYAPQGSLNLLKVPHPYLPRMKFRSDPEGSGTKDSYQPIIPTPLYQFDHARVVSGSSIDTGFSIQNSYNFDVYLNSNLSSGRFDKSYTFGTTGQQQSFAMCPPGYFLDGIMFSHHGIIMERVILLRCINPTTKWVFIRKPRQPIGASDSQISAKNITTLLCPRNHVVIRLDRSNPDWVNNLDLGCAPL